MLSIWGNCLHLQSVMSAWLMGHLILASLQPLKLDSALLSCISEVVC